MATVKWKRAGKKWTLKEAQNVGPIQLRRMTTEQRAELAQFYRNQFQLRLRQFTNAGVVSFAVSKLTGDMQEVSEKLDMKMDPFANVVTAKGKSRVLAPNFAERKNPQNALAAYIGMMQDFFKAKSSTVKGWKDIGEAQDKRLFGEVPIAVIPGRLYKKQQKIKYKTDLAYRMTDAERVLFWKVYREVSKTGWTSINDYSSDSQRAFATQWMNGDFNHKDFESAYHKMLSYLDERPDALREDSPGASGNPFQPEGDVDNVEWEW